MVEVIKFGAEWCGPCRMMKPTINTLSEKYNVEGSDVKITDVDVDKQPDEAKKWNVRNIPTMVFLRNGELIEKKVGVINGDLIDKIIQEITSIEKV